MCVRTLVGSETGETMSTLSDSKQTSGKLSRAKEKYMRLHEEMLEKQKLLRRREQEKNALYLPDLADDVLTASTAHYSQLLKKLAKYYEVVRRSKTYKFHRTYLTLVSSMKREFLPSEADLFRGEVELFESPLRGSRCN